MKKLAYFALSLLLLLDVGTRLIEPSGVSAQASSGTLEAGQVVSSLSSCVWASGSSVTNGVNFCFVNTGVPSTSGMYFALNGSTTWTPLVGATAGVTSFNGRTGAVTLTDADVTGTGLKVVTTVTSTATSTPQ